jgi:hypothetical protein
MATASIRVQHALRRLERLIIAREAAATIYKVEGSPPEYYKWRLLARKAARQHAKIARALNKLV